MNDQPSGGVLQRRDQAAFSNNLFDDRESKQTGD